MHERTNIQLSAFDGKELEAVVANRNSPQKHVWGAKIVLLTADAHGTAEIMLATGKAKTRNGTPLVVVLVTMRCEEGERRMEKGPAGFGTARRSPFRTGSCERWLCCSAPP